MTVQLEGALTLEERTQRWRQASKQSTVMVSCPYCGVRKGTACRSRSSGISRLFVHVRRFQKAADHLRRLGVRVLQPDFQTGDR